jgi:hypothetical protein
MRAMTLARIGGSSPASGRRSGPGTTPVIFGRSVSMPAGAQLGLSLIGAAASSIGEGLHRHLIA